MRCNLLSLNSDLLKAVGCVSICLHLRYVSISSVGMTVYEMVQLSSLFIVY